MSYTQRLVALFFVLNAIGNIPLFIALLGRYPAKKQRKIIFRELLIALGILLVFSFFGESILRLLGISCPIISIGGGVILFIIALGMIFPKEHKGDTTQREPFIVPMAIPLLAGPGAITMVMIYSDQIGNPFITGALILGAWLPTAIILLLASHIKHIMGEKGLLACERLGGMLICLLAIQMFAGGAIQLVKLSFPSQ